MSTEFKWSDLTPYGKIFKWTAKAIVGTAKAVLYCADFD